MKKYIETKSKIELIGQAYTGLDDLNDEKNHPFHLLAPNPTSKFGKPNHVSHNPSTQPKHQLNPFPSHPFYLTSIPTPLSFSSVPSHPFPLPQNHQNQAGTWRSTFLNLIA